MNNSQSQITVRPAVEDDIAAILTLDHGYSTEFVWQMEMDQGAPKSGARFKEARLPRPMQVNYPRAKETLETNWKERPALMVAENAGQVVGYSSLSLGLAPGAAWVTDLVVGGFHRRKGYGTRLVLAAQTWAATHGLERLVLEMQSKNFPAIRMAQKLAFEFSGYNDRFYQNQDIALFFAKRLT
jgi:ribosomal protein S18 acetylase RimI-like enzyme